MGTRLTPRDGEVLSRLFAIDTRALVVLRIGLGLLLLYHCAITQLDLEVDGGWWEHLVRFSWLAAVPFACMLVVGFHTRLASIGAWVLYALPIREALLSGISVPLQHYTLLLSLFWMTMLPLNGHLSLDARRGVEVRKGRVLSVGTAGLLIQVFLIYLFAGITKNFGEWVFEASALETLMTHPHYASALGERTARFPDLLALGSRLTVLLEIIGSLLLFIPVRGIETRRVFLASAFVGLHLAMAVMMDLATFPLVMIVVWAVFYPSKVWNRLWPSSGHSEFRDASRPRAVVASVALFYIVVSNVITWFLYPARDGLPGIWQEAGRHLVLYQQWAMFSLPSSL